MEATTVKWRQFSQSNRHSTIGTRQTEYHDALPSSANDEVRCDCTLADDGNASWYWVCRVPMVKWRLDFKDCRHLTVVGLRDAGPSSCNTSNACSDYTDVTADCPSQRFPLSILDWLCVSGDTAFIAFIAFLKHACRCRKSRFVCPVLVTTTYWEVVRPVIFAGGTVLSVALLKASSLLW